MIDRKGIKKEFITATVFGRRVAQLYIDPLSAVVMRDSLLEAEKKITRDFSYLHALSRTGELGSLYLRKGESETFSYVLFDNLDTLLSNPNVLVSPWGHETIISEVKMASFLQDWISEFSEEEIREKYAIAAGDVRSKVEVAGWMLYSMRELGRIMGYSKLGEIKKLEVRVKNGIKEELLELVSLKGVGRVRARMLFKKGYRNLKAFRKADITALSKVETIGKKVAQSILEQVLKS
jgi:helicase